MADTAETTSQNKSFLPQVDFLSDGKAMLASLRLLTQDQTAPVNSLNSTN
jgi:hypothetical protein